MRIENLFLSTLKSISAKIEFFTPKNGVIYHDVFVEHIWPIFTTELIQNLLARCSFKSAFANQQFGKIQHHVSLTFFAPYAKSYPPNISRIHAHFFFTFWSMNFCKNDFIAHHSGQKLLKKIENVKFDFLVRWRCMLESMTNVANLKGYIVSKTC